MADLKVIILGAGLAGSLLANGLLHNKIEFMVYERDEKDSKSEGYQIRLGAPALAGFKACLTQDQRDNLLPNSFPAYTKSAPINRAVLRDFLAKPIYEAEKLRYGKKFKDYRVTEDTEGKTRIKVLFEDGTQDEGDLLISAEGNRSRVNTQIGLNNIVQLTDKWGFLAKGDLPPSKLDILTPEVGKSPITCIKDGIVLFCSAYMPEAVDDGSANNATSASDLHNYDDKAASIFWGLMVPAERVSRGEDAITDKLQFCIDQIKEWDPRYHHLLRVIGNDDIYIFQAQAGLYCQGVNLLTHMQGMGGNQAMNDTADALLAILNLAEKAKMGKPLEEQDFASAVNDYESKMIPRAFGWVKTSGETGGGLVEPESWKGALMLFFVARALDVAYLVTVAGSFWDTN